MATETDSTIGATSNPFEIMTFKEEQKNLQKAYKIQEAVTDIGVGELMPELTSSTYRR